MADISVIIDVLGAEDMVKATRAANRMTNEYKTLDRALRKGQINAKQYAAGVAQVDAGVDALVASHKQASSAVNLHSKTMESATVANHAYAQSATMTGKRTNRMGVMMQQTGYQVGDFAVQVQSGTHMMVALGQQATQLVGTMGMLSNSTKMIGLFAGLGIVVPILTAIAGGLMRASGGAKSLTESLSDLNSKIDEFISLSESVGDFGAEGFGRVKEELKGTSDAYRDLITLAKLDAFDALSSSLESLSTTARNTNYILGDVGEVGNLLEIETQLRGNITVWKDNREQVRLFISDLRELENASSLDEQYQAAMRLREEFIRTVGPAEEMTKEQREFLKGLSESITKMELLGAATDDTSRGVGESAETVKRLMEDTNDLVEAGRRAVFERNKEFRASRLELERQIELMKVEREYGEDSLELVKARATQEAILKGFTTDQIAAYVALVVEAAKLRKELDDAEDSSEGILEAADYIDFSDATESAKALAKELGIALRYARAMDPHVRAARAATTPLGPTGTTTFNGADLDLYDDYRRDRDRVTPSSGGGGGGMSAAEKRAEAFRKAKDAVDALRASYDEQFATAQKVSDAEEKVNELIRLKPELAGEANQVLKDYKDSLQNLESPLKKIAETAKQAFGDAFTSIVDGTKSAKDAFKDMARAILKQAFDLLVVKPLMDSLFGGLTGGSGSGGGSWWVKQANGGAWDKGVQMFANGGVVNSATAFQHSGGLGVMGEAGPEAIMPLKRGKNGKLGVQLEGGSEQSVVINQSFNFSANGDDSVKRIIAQEAPKIANLTQRQVLEARARGGAFRNTFGG